jgi:aerobic carbon-monoxide dehydrogenase large subunit
MGHHAAQPRHVGRVEDRRLITGTGKYAADFNARGQLYGHFVRSDRAHAGIVSVNTAQASKSPGVVCVLTGTDAVNAGHTKAPNSLSFRDRNGTAMPVPSRPALAHGKVRFVGEAVALVVAASAATAQDAAELVEIEYRDLACVVQAEDALAQGAPQLHDNVPGNRVVEVEAGNADEVRQAFAAAAHVTRLKAEVTRVTASPMEPRSCLVTYDAARDEYLFNVCTQGGTTLRKQLSQWTGVPENQIKFEVGDVGGGFGQRSWAYPEYCALMLAAKQVGKPVKWTSTRSEGFLADCHGRSNIIEGELALDRNGQFLGMRMSWVNDMGAYISPGASGHIRNTSICMSGLYRIPALHALYRVVLTNTTPVSPYRGAGRPDVAYMIERLVAQAAAELGLDPVELRRRNLIPAEAFPYKTGTGAVYEGADPAGILNKALKLANWTGLPKRRSTSAARGKLRGAGLAMIIENTNAGAPEQLQLELDATGTVTVHTVSKSQGQSHETTQAMIVADALGIPFEQVKVMQLALNRNIKGLHVAGSRTTVTVGSLCYMAVQKLIEEGRTLAALELQVEPSQVTYANGQFRSAASQRPAVTLRRIAKSKALVVTVDATFGPTFPNSCHVAEVEIDPDTGATEIASYCAVDDCGVVISHTVVEGQLHGGVAQGAGQVLGEHVRYERESGQMLTGSFMDYMMPRAGLLPEMRIESHATPSKVSPLGVKGAGETGCTASIPAITNAVLDALRPLGITHLDMPLTPSKVWHAIQAARAK